MQRADIEKLAADLSRPSANREPNARAKEIIDRIVLQLMLLIEEFDITPEEFWTALSRLTDLGATNQFGLLVAGLGLEHYFDVRMDEREEQAGMATTGTPRTIEGPLYVAGAPVCKGEARLDDGTEQTEILFMDGTVKDTDGNPIPEALVEVWHANSLGNYSFFDKSQSDFNLRRSIIADADGRYRFRSTMPVGYAVPPVSPTQSVLDLLGRHGRRPAHIHFMVSAPGYRLLTTQINIQGDPYLYDDFAFATKEELIPEVEHHTAPVELASRGVDRPFATITFDFTLPHAVQGVPADLVHRTRAQAELATAH
jgi:catechol 1,2-dioxygenase